MLLSLSVKAARGSDGEAVIKRVKESSPAIGPEPDDAALLLM